jgi:anti-sigma regulatory factor (Ser/Thr protein kinase)
MSSLATPGPRATSSRIPPSCYAKSLGSPTRSPSFDRFRSAATSRAFRERLAYALAAEKVPEAKALDMLVAGTEISANADRHGGGVEEVRVGRAKGRFVCEIIDRGGGFDDPTAGYFAPRAGLGKGCGWPGS